MKKLPLLILVIILTLTIFQFSCNSPTAPKQNTPPDTTSNNFTWQKFTFGADNAGSSHLSDVAIISDTNIWCVGAVYLDSADGAPDPSAYNAVHWDGNNWKLEKIQFYTFCGQQQTGSYPASAVLSLGDSIIWIASINSQIAILNGDEQKNIMCLPVSVSKMWATSNKEVYTVGAIGQIGHYQNGTWTKMESGTTIDLRDIWGSSDGKTVWACGYSNDNSQSVLLKYNGSGWQTIWNSHPSAPPYGGLITSLWGDNKNLYLVGTDGVFKQDMNGKDSVSHLFSITHFPYCIRGSAENNIAFAGDDGMIYHYNRAEWKLVNLTNAGHPLYSVAVTTNLIIAVGSDYSTFPNKAMIYVGKSR